MKTFSHNNGSRSLQLMYQVTSLLRTYFHFHDLRGRLKSKTLTDVSGLLCLLSPDLCLNDPFLDLHLFIQIACWLRRISNFLHILCANQPIVHPCEWTNMFFPSVRIFLPEIGSTCDEPYWICGSVYSFTISSGSWQLTGDQFISHLDLWYCFHLSCVIFSR